MKKVLITGIHGQDGSYLADLLLTKGYDVYGMERRTSDSNRANSRHLVGKITFVKGDLTDQGSVTRVVDSIRPDEIYNLAAQSFVGESWNTPEHTSNVTGLGALRMLEAIRTVDKNIKFYQASSCLPAGTKVLVQKEVFMIRLGKERKMLTLGTENIENLKIGDKVLSYNLNSGIKEYKEIECIGDRIASDMYTLRFSNNNELRLSGNHPVYVHNKGWVRTDDLVIGDLVVQKRYNGLYGISIKNKKNDEIYGVDVSKEISRKSSNSQKKRSYIHPWKGKTIDEVYKNNPHRLAELHKIMSNAQKNNPYPSWNLGLTTESDIRLKNAGSKISIAHKRLWQTDGYAHKILSAQKRGINKLEQSFFSLLEEICCGEFVYNGDGRYLTIGGKTPDFVHIKGKNKLIELNGDHWHRNDIPGQRVDYFKKLGYETLEIWQSEIKRDIHEVKQRVLNFLYNPDVDVVSIVNIIKHDYEEKVYDIQVSDNHNFFAKGILVHNSEMFGKQTVDVADENTPFYPRSPYGVSKLYAHWMTKNYRESYGMFCCSGILYNHESVRRQIDFVTRKITDGVAKIRLGLLDHIALGNIDAKRDWGYAPDFVNGMYMMMQYDKPDDYVLATNTVHSVKDFIVMAFKCIGITEWGKYVKIDDKFKRPAEVDYLRGDYGKAKRDLGWEPNTDINKWVCDMVHNDISLLSNK